MKKITFALILCLIAITSVSFANMRDMPWTLKNTKVVNKIMPGHGMNLANYKGIQLSVCTKGFYCVRFYTVKPNNTMQLAENGVKQNAWPMHIAKIAVAHRDDNGMLTGLLFRGQSQTIPDSCKQLWNAGTTLTLLGEVGANGVVNNLRCEFN